jgi:hypothetical protein
MLTCQQKVTPNDHWIVRRWEDLEVLSSEGCPMACSAGVVVLVEWSEESLLSSMWKMNSEDQIEYMQYEMNLENN